MTTRRCQRGMVTAETAVLAPLVVLVVVLGLWIVTVGYQQVRLIDAARDVARLIARGDSTAAAIGRIRQEAPVGAHFAVDEGDELVTVRVTARVASPLPGLSWPLAADASCVDES